MRLGRARLSLSEPEDVAMPDGFAAESRPALADASTNGEDPRQALVTRLTSSSTFEKAPRLREFLVYICRCAIEGRRMQATEQQIGIAVFGRQPGYNANGDNIVRSQARLLRLKLEHHFANEGKDEPLIVCIPKGQYLPVFEERAAPHPGPPATVAAALPKNKPHRDVRRYAFVALTGLGVVVAISVGGLLLRSSLSSPSFWGTFLRKGSIANDGAREHTAPSAAAAVPSNQVRIAAGMTSGSHVDAWGHRWESDRYYRGGASQPGPKDLFPPPPDPGLVSTMRESVPPDPSQPASQGSFSYDIPVPSGVYELRLYFADPAKRSTGLDIREGGEDLRHFTVNLNGRPLLSDFDSIADGGFASVDVRAFKDVVPAADGKVHIEFVSGYLQRSFVNALELTPGTPGKLMPIRLCAHRSSFTDASGTLWSGDNFFINGRLLSSRTPTSEPGFPALYSEERYGNFSYAIPVPPGSYTVKLHFAETFFPMSSQAMLCHGSGCRVFDVTCNGVALLSDFDVLQTAGGAFRPVVRTFHGLRPNGQGKLLLSFSPSVNYAEVRAIEVIDEAQ